MSVQIESKPLDGRDLRPVNAGEDEPPQRVEALPSPHFLEALYPATPSTRACVSRGRAAIRRVIRGADRRRLVVIVGPCSIHSQSGALEYAEKLARLSRETESNLVIVMRAYFEKPRTRIGWKGLLNDPDLDGRCDLAKGLRVARKILLEINRLGLPCASEFLDPLAAPYLRDLVSWVAIGARTSESQTHRELASGLGMPVGFKNGTDGDLSSAHHAIFSAREPHTHLGIGDVGIPAVIRTLGNPDGHLVLRGGGGRPNCSPEEIEAAEIRLSDIGIDRPIIVDCSHENSLREASRQILVAQSVVEQILAGRNSIAGIMLESNLEAGRQDLGDSKEIDPGKSLTDACLGWNETEKMIIDLANAMER